jgi:hypothetical protein
VDIQCAYPFDDPPSFSFDNMHAVICAMYRLTSKAQLLCDDGAFVIYAKEAKYH